MDFEFLVSVGGAQSGSQKYGLTEFGRKALIRMRELGMVVDLAHSSNMLIGDVVAVPADQRKSTSLQSSLKQTLSC
jgi:microsomal dipeptidase-like Zn-dependent dipeptidase